MAILNANYLRKRLESVYTLATHEPCMHECVFSDRSFHQTGVKTLDIGQTSARLWLLCADDLFPPSGERGADD